MGLFKNSLGDFISGEFSGGPLNTINYYIGSAFDSISDAFNSVSNKANNFFNSNNKTDMKKFTNGFNDDCHDSVINMSNKKDDLPGFVTANGGNREEYERTKLMREQSFSSADDLDDIAIEEGRYIPDSYTNLDLGGPYGGLPI